MKLPTSEEMKAALDYAKWAQGIPVLGGETRLIADLGCYTQQLERELAEARAELKRKDEALEHIAHHSSDMGDYAAAALAQGGKGAT